MDARVQQELEQQLALAEDLLRASAALDDDTLRRGILTFAAGSLTALHNLGLIESAEYDTWAARLHRTAQ